MSSNDLHQTLSGMLEKRMDSLCKGAGERATREQRHLKEGSEERVYWHYGYASALKDVLILLKDAGAPVN